MNVIFEDNIFFEDEKKHNIVHISPVYLGPEILLTVCILLNKFLS